MAKQAAREDTTDTPSWVKLGCCASFFEASFLESGQRCGRQSVAAQSIQGIWASSPLACSFGRWTSSSISIPGPLQLVREVCFLTCMLDIQGKNDHSVVTHCKVKRAAREPLSLRLLMAYRMALHEPRLNSGKIFTVRMLVQSRSRLKP